MSSNIMSILRILILALCLSLPLSLSILHQAQAQAQAQDQTKFWIGSYGRMGLSVDPKGRSGQVLQITPYKPRLLEDNYMELDIGYHAYQGQYGKVDMVTTTAYFDQIFHYDGQAKAQLALRRAFVEVKELAGTDYFISLGTRWLRGNDIYLLNFWPLDDLNTMGLTVGKRNRSINTFLHWGLSRLDQKWQTQRVFVPSATGFGAEEILFLDRQRNITAFHYECLYETKGGMGWKWKFYAEHHALPSGSRALDGSYTQTEQLPDDLGFLVGLQLSLWKIRHPQDFLNLWIRYAKGLAVFDELASPYGLARDQRSWKASEYRIAMAGNHVFSRLSIQWGGYFRAFRDADGQKIDFDDRQDASLVVRPQLNYGFFTPAIEASTQLSYANGLTPTSQRQGLASIYQFALIPAISFGEEIGSFTRPQLRLIYSVSLLNPLALERFAPIDPRSQASIVHYLGARVEWWFGRGGGY